MAKPELVIKISARDRAWVEDYIQFGVMNHVVAAEALRRAYAEAADVAAAIRTRVDRTDEKTGAATAARLNDAARIQTIVVARLTSEYAAAVEDLAGMVVAIRDRDAGVMRSYLLSRSDQTGTVLADLDAGRDLAEILGLPSAAELPATLEPDLVSAVENLYGKFAKSLRQIAAAGRMVAPEEAVGAGVIPDDRVVLILDVGAPAGGPRGLLFQAHNRIKHRFMVVERLDRLGVLPDEPIRFGHLPRDPGMVRQAVANIASVALATGELAAVLLALSASDGSRVDTSEERDAPSQDPEMG